MKAEERAEEQNRVREQVRQHGTAPLASTPMHSIGTTTTASPSEACW
jgi:hypothetical protein